LNRQEFGGISESLTVKKKKKEKNINSIFFFLRHTPGGDGDRVGIREEEEEGKKRKDGND